MSGSMIEYPEDSLIVLLQGSVSVVLSWETEVLQDIIDISLYVYPDSTVLSVRRRCLNSTEQRIERMDMVYALACTSLALNSARREKS